jgi:hypothetical protein
MSSIDVVLTQFLGTVKALSVVAMAKPPSVVQQISKNVIVVSGCSFDAISKAVSYQQRNHGRNKRTQT